MPDSFQYKIEFNYNDDGPADAGCYIQIRRNVPIYQNRIDKEFYDVKPDEEKHEFLTGLFNIAGVTEVATQAYRVWLMKSPVYDWDEVLEAVLDFMKGSYGDDPLESLPGSGWSDGQGFTLESPSTRRPLKNKNDGSADV